MTDQDTKEFPAARTEAAKHIAPETAEVYWAYGQTMDPYGIDPDLPDELRCVQRVYFARSPDSDIWVCFYDLPEEIRSALWEKHKRQLAFPAGLSLAPEQELTLGLPGDETQ
jgi:hypothetical protein